MRIENITGGNPAAFTPELLGELIETQLEAWPEARARYEALGHTLRKPLRLGDLEGAVQYNPARIVSTGAKTDAASVAARPCFLCGANRPAEQMAVEWPTGWDFLVNPYPILPLHFTVASRRHVPQERTPLEMASMAEAMPGMVFFFNGAKAGASAPDHLHVQAVLRDELPLVRLAEQNHPAFKPGIMKSDETGLTLPFRFWSAVVTPDEKGMETLALLRSLSGADAETGSPDPGLVNAFFWIRHDGLLQALVIPRRRHRPDHYYTEGSGRVTVAPGAIDMAGLIITPLKEDYARMDAALATDIYKQVAYA